VGRDRALLDRYAASCWPATRSFHFLAQNRASLVHGGQATGAPPCPRQPRRARSDVIWLRRPAEGPGQACAPRPPYLRGRDLQFSASRWTTGTSPGHSSWRDGHRPDQLYQRPQEAGAAAVGHLGGEEIRVRERTILGGTSRRSRAAGRCGPGHHTESMSPGPGDGVDLPHFGEDRAASRSATGSCPPAPGGIRG